MFLKKLKLKNFRNYETCEVDFSGNKILLAGKNAQGKTNLLEAVYYLATLSSFRTSSDSELLRWNSSNCLIEADFSKYDTDINLKIIINPPKQKVLKVNGLKKSSFSDFLSNLAIVNFNVADLLLLRGTPSDRRKWLDNAISQIYPAYKDRLNKYSRILTLPLCFINFIRNQIIIIMSNSVYKVIELVGSSSESWEKAAGNAIARASETLRDLRIAEVVQLDMNIKDGKVESYRAKVKVSFKFEG